MNQVSNVTQMAPWNRETHPPVSLEFFLVAFIPHFLQPESSLFCSLDKEIWMQAWNDVVATLTRERGERAYMHATFFWPETCLYFSSNHFRPRILVHGIFAQWNFRPYIFACGNFGPIILVQWKIRPIILVHWKLHPIILVRWKLCLIMLV